jgi:hypothetical protein
VITNYDFHQISSITGTVPVPAGVSVYNMVVALSGMTTANLPFVTQYVTDNYFTNQPLASTSYLIRIFNFADCNQPISIQTQLILSIDGQTSISYPSQTIPSGTWCTLPIVLSLPGVSTVTGNVIFDPPHPAGNIYPGIQAEGIPLGGTGFGSAATKQTPNPAGGSYTLPLFAGDWPYWRFGWNFLDDPTHFLANYFISQFLDNLNFNNNADVQVPSSSPVTKNWNFDTAFLKVYFTAPFDAPPNTTITDPQLDSVSGFLTGGVFSGDATADVAHSEGLNQTGVTTGEAHMVLRVHHAIDPSNNNDKGPAVFKVTPSATINLGGVPANGRTTFSPFYVTPNKGDVIIVGVPGTLSLVVNTPQDGQTLTTCSIPVSGYATGAANITITVNGITVPTHAAPTPNDPFVVTFTTTVAGGGATTITVKASAPANAPVTDVLHVTATSATIGITSSVGMSMLWPPNHDLINVGLTATSSTACDSNPTMAVKVFSNEADTAAGNGGDDQFSPDAKDSAPGTLRLRSERLGDGNGRVYLIVSTGSDHSGDSGFDCTSVVVPHDQSAASVAAILAAANAAVASCKSTGLPPSGFVQVGIGPVIGPKQ